MSLSKSEVTPERRWSLPLSWQTIGSPIHPINLIFPSASNCVNKVPKVFTASSCLWETFSRNLFDICLYLHLLLYLLNYSFSALCFWFMSDWTSLLFRLDVTSEPSISLFPWKQIRTMFVYLLVWSHFLVHLNSNICWLPLSWKLKMLKCFSI